MEWANNDSEARSGAARAFSTTHWSVVLEAGKEGTPEGTAALEILCNSYWYPLYVFVRRKGHSPHDAQDLTQEFFARFLQNKYVALADQSRGKFRTFLLRSMENFLINEWTKAHAAKRGGFTRTISWDENEAEKRYALERPDGCAPDKYYEKLWANRLLDKVMEQLREEFKGERTNLFKALKMTLLGEPTETSYQEIANRLGMAEGTVKVAAHRMRQRYRDLLWTEVALTVSSPKEVVEELKYLAAVLRS